VMALKFGAVLWRISRTAPALTAVLQKCCCLVLLVFIRAAWAFAAHKKQSLQGEVFSEQSLPEFNKLKVKHIDCQSCASSGFLFLKVGHISACSFLIQP